MTVDSTLQEDLEVLKSRAEGEKVTSLSVLTVFKAVYSAVSATDYQAVALTVSRSMRTFCECSQYQVCRYTVSGLALVTSAESPPLTLGAGVLGGGF